MLSDGTELDADIVVVGIGSRPATDWLDGSGIEVDNGVVCDDAGRTAAAQRVGHRRRRVLAGRRRDIKCALSIGATSPSRRGCIVPAMLGKEIAADGRRCPTSGATSTTSRSSASASREADDIVHVVEDDGRKFLAYYERDGVVVGVVGGGMPGKVMKARGQDRQRRPDRRRAPVLARFRRGTPR